MFGPQRDVLVPTPNMCARSFALSPTSRRIVPPGGGPAVSAEQQRSIRPLQPALQVEAIAKPPLRLPSRGLASERSRTFCSDLKAPRVLAIGRAWSFPGIDVSL